MTGLLVTVALSCGCFAVSDGFVMLFCSGLCLLFVGLLKLILWFWVYRFVWGVGFCLFACFDYSVVLGGGYVVVWLLLSLLFTCCMLDFIV